MAEGKRPSIEDRMNQWLNDQADAAEIPDHQRQRFIDHMRGTSAFAAARLSMLLQDVGARIVAPPN